MLQRRGRFTENAARFYAAEVLLALESLHSLGVVYRDLKPENVLLREDGHVQLTDFDLSLAPPPQLLRQRRHGGGRVAFWAVPEARSNSMVGTEEYTAPEVVTGAGHGVAVDFWALGVLLFELLAGFSPFRGGSRSDTFDHILWAPPAALPPDVAVSPEVRDLLARLLDKDPATRLGARHGAAEAWAHPF
eukprot:SM005827S18328  [mRNA]  locus=s5827:135:953:+ [translate_table: standard]